MLQKLLIIYLFLICSFCLYSQTSKEANNTLEAVSIAYEIEINSSFAYAKFSAASENKAIINLFQAVSDSKSCHANILYDAAIEDNITDTILKAQIGDPKVGEDIENLQSAASMTSYEYTKMYPELLKVINKDNKKEMAEKMNNIIKVEKAHNFLFTQAINNIQNNKPLADKYYLCETCGYIEANLAPNKCPICGKHKNTFKEYK
ncbi:rubrerythrin family protein [Brachyspira hampsonii]|uniref:Putative rubrerythrin n=1 Tax=Brachyspira hampsonii 30446 TaxID=1289135 RepID=A0A2U4EW19_9SPIR|nr:ferritin family protein [Brachyspira hampsonii]EKV57128.1 putative rubrerythrin [Brachyspira hampsonii 30446]MBW5389218.1 rubrerythrin family protein [Brachyspira hampsonii]MBW5393818.1 rubrerythrin family protein [Brachyspira hampsonii]OEJ16931.1 rubrerythrin [Brachyspira hampsonii]